MSLYNSALLADAAYIDFSPSRGMYDLATGIINNDSSTLGFFKQRGFTQDQFDYLQKKYLIAAHLPNTATGLSLTIFENKTTHELTIAFRGTEPPETGTLSFLQDLFRDLVLVVDFDVLTGGIGADGEIVKYGFAFGSHKAQEFALSKTSMLLCDFCRQSAHFLH